MEAIRKVLTSRWPYPLTHDNKMEKAEGSNTDWWMFKVKRYPWAVSYGNKHVDKAVEAAKVLAEQRQIKLPSPKNMDSESAKSLLVFLLKVIV